MEGLRRGFVLDNMPFERHFIRMIDPVRKLPQTADGEVEHLKAAIEDGRAAIARNAFVDHARVRAWLVGLASGKKAPRPRP